MLISIAFGLNVQLPTSLNLSTGETKSIQINLTNTLNAQNVIGVVGYSDNATIVVLSPSRTLTMDSNSNTSISFSIAASDARAGNYKVTFIFSSTEDNAIFSRVMTVNVAEMLDVRPVYSYVKATTGDYITLKFIIINSGNSGRTMVIDPESFPDEFNAVYPDPFHLDAGESKTVSIKVTIPPDYHSGVYSTTITVLSGEVKKESTPFDLSITKASTYKNVVLIDAVEIGGFTNEDGQRGYDLMIRVDNRKDEGITGIDVSGFPLGWNVSGDTNFYVDANTVRDIDIKVMPTDYNDHTLDILLTKNDIVLANTTVTFSGQKAGLVGYAFFGGSLTIGLLIIVIAVLVLLYVRQRNIQADETESKTEKAQYLKNLVDEAKEKEL
jgi:uncharacterized membrane protein